MSESEKNLTATEKMIEVEEMLKHGAPLTIISKTLGIPLAAIHHLRDEKANNNE